MKMSIIALNTCTWGSVIFGLQNTFKIGALVFQYSFLILSTHRACFSNTIGGFVDIQWMRILYWRHCWIYQSTNANNVSIWQRDSILLKFILYLFFVGGCNCKSDRAFKFVFASERCVNEPQVVSYGGDDNKRLQDVTIHNTCVAS